MIRRTLLAAIVAVGSLALLPSPADACSCVGFTKPDYARQAAVIFTGTVTRVDVHSGPLVFSSIDPVDVFFDVEAVYKGDVARTFQVSTVASSASCGYEFAAGRRYTVFARLADGKVRTDSCGGTNEGAINPAPYLLSGGYPPGADPLVTLRSVIVIGVLIAGGVLVVATRLRARPPS
jgi:hypothetical protein